MAGMPLDRRSYKNIEIEIEQKVNQTILTIQG
jgi:hypothetical protein